MEERGRGRPSQEQIRSAMQQLPVGSRLSARVAEVWRFGLFLDLLDFARVGFLAYPYAGEGGSSLSPDAPEVPRVDDVVQVEVIAHQPDRHQIWLHRV